MYYVLACASRNLRIDAPFAFCQQQNLLDIETNMTCVSNVSKLIWYYLVFPKCLYSVVASLILSDPWLCFMTCGLSVCVCVCVCVCDFRFILSFIIIVIIIIYTVSICVVFTRQMVWKKCNQNTPHETGHTHTQPKRNKTREQKQLTFIMNRSTGKKTKTANKYGKYMRCTQCARVSPTKEK